MEREEKTFNWKTYELNIFTFHLIVAFLALVLNILAYHIHLFTYGYEFWYVINHKWDTLMMVNIAIPVVAVIIWDIFHWNYWRFSGVVFVIIYTFIFMMFVPMVEDGAGVLTLAAEMFFVIISAMAFGKPGGFFDKVVSGYVDRKYSDTDEDQLGGYDSQIMSLRAYYKGDMEPYEVLYEQVNIMLEHEILDDAVVDILSAKENEIYDYTDDNATSSLSLDNPNYNPLHSVNRYANKDEYYSEIIKYAEAGLLADFLADYKGKKDDKDYKPSAEKEYDISEVEKTMRKYIEQLDQPELLLRYCVIALYKNVPDYKKFSVMAARTYATLYIQNHIVDYGEFFVDLIALLNSCGITEVEEFDFEED